MFALGRTAAMATTTLVVLTSRVLAGDPAYGEYLSGECVSCHQKSGADDGIPPIIGWDELSFVAVMQSYKKGDRDNEVMRNVAKSLDQEQIEALAAYFASLEEPED